MRGLRRFLSVRVNVLALIIVGGFLFVAVCAPLLLPPDDPELPTPYKVVEGVTQPNPLEPGPEAPLGTVAYYHITTNGVETLHFDVLYSLIWGTRSVLRFGLITALTTALIGIVFGALSGYWGGVVNMLAMRLTDVFLAFPVIAGVWVFRILMETANLQLMDYNNFVPVNIPASAMQKLVLALNIEPVMLTLILFSWMPYARIINANVQVLKQTEYAMAAKVIGAKGGRIMFRHLIPNALAPAIVLLARDIGGLVIAQAAFAFIGLSGAVQSTAIPEWSRLLMLGRNWVIGQNGNPFIFWWAYVPVTLALILFGIGWNLLGDGLNIMLNPRSTEG